MAASRATTTGVCVGVLLCVGISASMWRELRSHRAEQDALREQVSELLSAVARVERRQDELMSPSESLSSALESLTQMSERTHVRQTLLEERLAVLEGAVEHLR